MYHIADALIRLLAPILAHTADEAYLSLKGLKTDSPESVHLGDMPGVIEIDTDPNWDSVMELRGKVLKALEDAKESQGVSNPLDTGVEVTAEPEEYIKLKPFEAELADLCGVSRFSIREGEDFIITIADLKDEPRCERSWKRDGTVRERSDGGFLSDRDAKALGLS